MTAYEMRISDWSSDVCSSDSLSHQSVRVSVAIDDHHRHEPFAVQSPEDPNPIEVDFVIVGALIGTDPALLIPRIPEKIGLLGLQEPIDRKSTRLNSSH